MHYSAPYRLTGSILRRHYKAAISTIARAGVDGVNLSSEEPVKIEIEHEEDGRWLAEVPELPGVLAYGQSRQEAIARVEALALRVIADRLDHGEAIPELDDLFALPA